MRKLIKALLAAAAFVPALLVATPGPAQAALPHCTGSTWFRVAGHQWFVEIPSVGNGTAATDCQLARGDSSAAVRVLQRAINSCYGQGLAVDGVFGPATERAVRNVQNFHRINGSPGVVVDGIYGPQTRSVMVFPKFSAPGGGSFLGCFI
jgi:peptidoglycan hydrolase-like protein with peptidoglycan-binding domain